MEDSLDLYISQIEKQVSYLWVSENDKDDISQKAIVNLLTRLKNSTTKVNKKTISWCVKDSFRDFYRCRRKYKPADWWYCLAHTLDYTWFDHYDVDFLDLMKLIDCEKERYILYEHYFKGRSFGELQKDLGCSNGNVSHHHLKGLKKLKEKLEQLQN